MPVSLYNFSFARRKEVKQKILIFISSFIALLVVLQLILMFLLRPMFITSSSMEPGIVQDGAVFVLPLAPNRPGFLNATALERGSVVYLASLYPSQKTTVQKIIDFACGLLTFQQYHPFEKLENNYSEMYRVVGFPGETLYVKDYVAYIRQSGDSHFLTEFELSSVEYDILTQDIPRDWDMSMGSQGNSERLTLTDDEYFLLSDNRLIAVDSRVFGPVKEERISGRALLQYFPITGLRVFP